MRISIQLKRLQVAIISGMQFRHDEYARLQKFKKWICSVKLSPCQRWTFENCFTCGRNLWPMRRNPNHKNLSLYVCDRLPFKCENRTIKIRVKHKNYLSVCDFMQWHVTTFSANTFSCLCGEILHLCFQLLLCGFQHKLRKFRQWNCPTGKL